MASNGEKRHIFGEKVRPGWLYDFKTSKYEPGQGSDGVQVEDHPPDYDFFIWRQDYLLKLLEQSKSGKIYPWSEQFTKWNTENTLLLKGVKVEEKRGVNVEPSGEKGVVRSVYHKYHVQMLVTLSDNMDKYVEKDFIRSLKKMINQSTSCFLPPFVSTSMKTCYILPEAHKCSEISSVTHGLKEFIRILGDSDSNCIPSTAFILYPSNPCSSTIRGFISEHSNPSVADIVNQDIPSSYTVDILEPKISTHNVDGDPNLNSISNTECVSSSESTFYNNTEVWKLVGDCSNEAGGSKPKCPRSKHVDVPTLRDSSSSTNDVPNPEYPLSNSATVVIPEKSNYSGITAINPNFTNPHSLASQMPMLNKTDDFKPDISSFSTANNTAPKKNDHESRKHNDLKSGLCSSSTTKDATVKKEGHTSSMVTVSFQVETRHQALHSDTTNVIKLKSAVTTYTQSEERSQKSETEKKDNESDSIMKVSPTAMKRASYIQSSPPVHIKDSKCFLKENTDLRKKESTHTSKNKLSISKLSEANNGTNPTAEEKHKHCHEEREFRGNDTRGSIKDNCSESRQSAVHDDETSTVFGSRVSKVREQNKLKDQENPKPSSSSIMLEPVNTENVLGMKRKYYSVKSSTEGKVILLLGASGSGKTTLVNFVANYFHGNKKADDDLVQVAVTRSDAQSITKDITAYTFYSDSDDTPITIIDTPGLNDSSGAEVRDHVISLKTFLANITSQNYEIHAIGFVAQAHLVRLTSSERLVMDYISTLFGECIRDHIVTFITFSDNLENPPIVEAMTNYGVKCKLFLKFNNSALNTGVTEAIDDLDRVYWRKGCKTWKKCVKVLQELPPLSVNSMKSLQSEVYETQVIAHAEKELMSELKTYIKYANKPTGHHSSESFKICELVWELATTLTYLKKTRSSNMQQSVNNTVVEYTENVCQEERVGGPKIVKMLSLVPSSALVKTGVGIIQGAESIYKLSRECKMKPMKMPKKKLPSSLYCHYCHKLHPVERIENKRSYNPLANTDATYIIYKCKVCSCKGDLHGEPNQGNATSMASSINSDYLEHTLLERTRKNLLETVSEHSIPGYVVCEQNYLKHLNYVTCEKYTDFIKCLWDMTQ